MDTEKRNQKVWRIALAALLHDVGKLAQRAEIDPERYRSLENLHEFAVVRDGTTSYHHAAYTWQFLADHAPWLAHLGEGDENVATWAARHHKPSGLWDHVVAEADRLSAGMDRGHADEAAMARGWPGVRSARLTPVAARVNGYCCGGEIPLRRLATDSSMFPVAAGTATPGTNEYRPLLDGFAGAIAAIPPGDLRRFFESALTAYEAFAWCVPAATNTTPCDVSLVEHSRVASAIAAALAYELEREGATAPSAATNRKAARYLIAVGDLNGIQGFLYTIVSRFAARSLRGRSVALHLLADAIARRFLDVLDLPPSTLLYSGGGKIWLLLPTSLEARAAALAEETDLALFRDYDGRLGFSLGLARMTGEDLLAKRVGERLGDATADMQSRRRRRFRHAARDRYADVFAPIGEGHDACRVCGQLASELAGLDHESERLACHQCRRLETVGLVLPRAATIIRATGPGWEGAIARVRDRLGGRLATFSAPAEVQVGFVVSDSPPEDVAGKVPDGVTLLAVNTVPMTFASEAAVSMTFFGRSQAVTDAGASLDFEELASGGEGVKRLGILRLDVDSLGEIFRAGFPDTERTLSRITNLSRSLSYFFGGHVSHLVATRWSDRAQVIYSGGDDVFVVGAWSAMPQIAREIRSALRDYTAANPVWGLSGGIAIVRAGHPVAAAAERAGELESTAKAFRRPSGQTKNALAFLDGVLGWEDLDVAADLKDALRDLLEQGAPRSVLHRYASISELERGAREALDGTVDAATLRDRVERGRWSWVAAYLTARAGSRGYVKGLLEKLPGTKWGDRTSSRPLVELLGIAARWSELLERRR